MNKKELKEAQEIAYNAFSKLHPIESYTMNPKKFCNWIRKEGYKITNKQVKELINENI
jgi:hypothetical protein